MYTIYYILLWVGLGNNLSNSRIGTITPPRWCQGRLWTKNFLDQFHSISFATRSHQRCTLITPSKLYHFLCIGSDVASDAVVLIQVFLLVIPQPGESCRAEHWELSSWASKTSRVFEPDRSVRTIVSEWSVVRGLFLSLPRFLCSTPKLAIGSFSRFRGRFCRVVCLQTIDVDSRESS